jgi:hypothetical protein
MVVFIKIKHQIQIILNAFVKQVLKSLIFLVYQFVQLIVKEIQQVEYAYVVMGSNL